ncbi:MAG: glycosyltransferase family 2 protein [Bdellovibrio sp.]|nr:glycosyltransferase family 2 protein [Bdellovibrio sp.]
MAHTPLSVTIITLNEESKIAKAIQSVSWADDILIVDSGSSDRTLEIAKQNGARVLVNPWTGYGQQKNFAQSHAKFPWVLNIDADEWVSKDLASEIRAHLDSLSTEPVHPTGFQIPRKTFYLGRWIKHGGWYPNYLHRLTHRDFAKWTEPEVHEKLEVHGETVRLKNPLNHDAFDTIADQILTNLKFARLGSKDLVWRGQQPSIFKLLFKPLWKFIETFFLKRGFLDGLPGFIISINAAHSMFLKYAFLFEKKIRPVQRANATPIDYENSDHR